MAKHKILIQGNYGPAGKLTKQCIKFIESKGEHYPDILKYRHNPILIEMFDKFAESVKGSNRKILYTEPIEGLGDYRGYFIVTEIDEDIYCITEYDGAEGVQTIKDFNWIKIKDNNNVDSKK